MEFVIGRWYKNLGEQKNHIGKFSGWYDSKIISVSEYIYEGKLRGASDCFASAYEFAKECHLSEIQQYLPEGHPDKEFILPEKWCVKDYKEVSRWASKVFGCEYHVDSSRYLCVEEKEFPNVDSYFFYSREFAYDYTEITFEQFKKYILKTKEMEEREIIGYKLKEDCKQYKEAIKKLGSVALIESEIEYLTIKQNNQTIPRLKESGVLDLWFEPVYKEEFKIGDYILLYDLEKSEFNGDIVKITSISPDKYHEKWIGHTPGSFSGGGFGYLPFKSNFRKATPEEVEEATKPKFPQIEINGYKGEFENNYVKFGCAKIDKSIFINLNNLTNTEFAFNINSNKFIESITIGKGTFSKEQIKEIADYYTKKDK